MEDKIGRQRFSKTTGMSVLPPLQQMPLFTQTESASLAEAQRIIESMQKENDKLREQLHDVRQLVMENEHENFSERRVNLLKSQNIQLKRQILTLTEAIGSRASVQLEVENALGTIVEHCRSYLTTRDRLGEVSVQRGHLKLLVETAESARIKLYKNIENTATENLQRPLMFMDHFVQHHPDKHVTMMDVCSGHLEHLNLKDIAKLESKLAELYKQVMMVNQSFEMIVSPDKGVANDELPRALYARLWGQVSRTCTMLKESSWELLELSLLVPAAPWPLVHRPMLKELTVDAVMERLPNFPRSKVNDAREMIQALLRAMSYTTHMKHAENDLLKEEVAFHQAVYQLQLDYVQTFFNALREGYKTFEKDTNDILCEPLKAILEAYSVLQRTAAEDALRNFLTVFKVHVSQISDAVEKLAPKDNKERDDALSDFGRHFFESIDQIRIDSQGRRDDLINDLDDATIRQQKAMEHVMEFVCSGVTKEDQAHVNKLKNHDSSDRPVTEVKTETFCDYLGYDSSDRPVTEVKTESFCDSGENAAIELTGDTTHVEMKGSGLVQGDGKHRAPSGQMDGQQLVHDGRNDVTDVSSSTVASALGVGKNAVRHRKKWVEPTGLPLSPVSRTPSPLLTARAKRRSVPSKGIAQHKLVLVQHRRNQRTPEDKDKQTIADIDIAQTDIDTRKSRCMSRSANRSPNEFSKRSQWK